VPQRHRRKRLGISTAETVVADASNQVWAVDFQFDATTDGRPIKIVSIVDEHTRECLGGLVERSITAEWTNSRGPATLTSRRTSAT
jgi:putative transposase